MISGMTDEAIMKRVQEGSLDEMSVLFERYHLQICNFFFRLTFNMDISQDLTQNLFYRMIKYRASYNEAYSVKSWMFQIARNLHADFRNDEKKAGEVILKAEDYPSDVAEEGESFAEDDYTRLDRALEGLSGQQKEIIILSRYQGLKYEEISEIMNQSVPAIKVAVHRAIKQLRGIYFKEQKHEM
jgi:RNA polymerase sigma factor (sigma-70 family)